MRFDPPCEMAADGALRLVLAKDHLAANTTRRLTVTVELPGATDWFPSLAEIPDEPGIATWYPWQGNRRGHQQRAQHGRLAREARRQARTHPERRATSSFTTASPSSSGA